MIRNDIADLVTQAIKNAQAAGALPGVRPAGHRNQPAQGSCQGRLHQPRGHAIGQARRGWRRWPSPRRSPPICRPRDFIAAVEVAPPGFINFRLSDALAGRPGGSQSRRAAGRYGDIDLGGGKSCQVEFISANPTGPLHMGSARNAVLGDALASVLAAAGCAGPARILRERRRHADAHLRRDPLPALSASVRPGCAAGKPPLPGRLRDGSGAGTQGRIRRPLPGLCRPKMPSAH